MTKVGILVFVNKSKLNQRIYFMRILFVNWKDWQHPKSGGAEVVLREICQRLIQNNHQVSLLTAVYPIKNQKVSEIKPIQTEQNKNNLNSEKNLSQKQEKPELSPRFEVLDGISVIRTGQNKFLHSLFANFYYQKNLVGEFDLVVEMVNTAPYFLGFNNFWNNFWSNLNFTKTQNGKSQNRKSLPTENAENLEKVQNTLKKINLKSQNQPKNQSQKFLENSVKNFEKNHTNSTDINFKNGKLENESQISNSVADLTLKFNSNSIQKSDSDVQKNSLENTKNSVNNSQNQKLGNSKKITSFALFYHQLAREIWWLETSFPINFVGFYILEPVATWLQSRLNCQTITISNSSKNDLAKFGFNSTKISVISEGIDNEPLENLQLQLPKESIFTILYHGSLRPMKRPLEVLESFAKFKKLLENQNLEQNLVQKLEFTSIKNTKKILEKLESSQKALNLINLEKSLNSESKIENQGFSSQTKKEKSDILSTLGQKNNSEESEKQQDKNSQKTNSTEIPCQLWISGNGEEMAKCQDFCKNQKITNYVKFWGRTSDEQKLELMQKSHLGLATSIKEGWGLIVTETNSMGTPCVVYNVDGLRDSGALPGNFVVENSDEMAAKMLEIYNLWQTEKLQKEKKFSNFEKSKNKNPTELSQNSINQSEMSLEIKEISAKTLEIDLKNLSKISINKNSKNNNLTYNLVTNQNSRKIKFGKVKKSQKTKTKKSFQNLEIQNFQNSLDSKNQPKVDSNPEPQNKELQNKYTKICQNAFNSSKKITFENCYRDFCQVLGIEKFKILGK